jgi:hypothetical protein
VSSNPVAMWRAEWAMNALWMVAHERKTWVKVLGGHNPHRASYLEVHVRPIPGLVQAETLRLWRRDMEHFLDGLEPWEREELEGHLATTRYRAVFRVRRDRGRVERTNVSESLAELALKLGELLREVKREEVGIR